MDPAPALKKADFALLPCCQHRAGTRPSKDGPFKETPTKWLVVALVHPQCILVLIPPTMPSQLGVLETDGVHTFGHCISPRFPISAAVCLSDLALNLY